MAVAQLSLSRKKRPQVHFGIQKPAPCGADGLSAEVERADEADLVVMHASRVKGRGSATRAASEEHDGAATPHIANALFPDFDAARAFDYHVERIRRFIQIAVVDALRAEALADFHARFVAAGHCDIFISKMPKRGNEHQADRAGSEDQNGI